MSKASEIEPTETVLYEAHPSMFRNHPFWFVLCVLTIPIGIGAIALLSWWLDSRSKRLLVTDKRVSLHKGLLSKSTNDVFHNDIRNVRVEQTFFQRIMGVGYIGISSAGQGGIEIEAYGIPEPGEVRTIIDRYR